MKGAFRDADHFPPLHLNPGAFSGTALVEIMLFWIG
jgi:hypothetical protein